AKALVALCIMVLQCGGSASAGALLGGFMDEVIARLVAEFGFEEEAARLALGAITELLVRGSKGRDAKILVRDMPEFAELAAQYRRAGRRNPVLALVAAPAGLGGQVSGNRLGSAEGFIARHRRSGVSVADVKRIMPTFIALARHRLGNAVVNRMLNDVHGIRRLL
ncbi:MAG: hypothetical protein AAGB03_02210, partial [Pseudomonadota bacterium]